MVVIKSIQIESYSPIPLSSFTLATSTRSIAVNEDEAFISISPGSNGFYQIDYEYKSTTGTQTSTVDSGDYYYLRPDTFNGREISFLDSNGNSVFKLYDTDVTTDEDPTGNASPLMNLYSASKITFDFNLI